MSVDRPRSDAHEARRPLIISHGTDNSMSWWRNIDSSFVDIPGIESKPEMEKMRVASSRPRGMMEIGKLRAV